MDLCLEQGDGDNPGQRQGEQNDQGPGETSRKTEITHQADAGCQQTQVGEESQGGGPEPPQAVPDLSVGVAECFRHAAFSLRLGWIGHPPALEELCGRDP